MSGDTTIGSLKRLTYLPDRNPDEEQGLLIAGQDYFDVYFTGGEIRGVDIINATITNPIFSSPLSLSNGGTGASLSAPVTDRVYFYDVSAGSTSWLTLGAGLTITDTTLSVAGAGLGDVTGPTSATENSVARFNGTTGKIIEDSSVTIDDGGNITASNLSGNNTGDQTITLTGDVTGTGTGSFSATISNNAVTNAKIRQSSGVSVIGNPSNSASNPSDIAASADGQVLRRSGTSLGFGQLNLASSNAVTGALPIANGGTGSTSAGAALTALGAATSAQGAKADTAVQPAQLILNNRFQSTDQTITAAGLLTIPHGFGAVPEFCVFFLKCTTADIGFSVNDIVQWGTVQYTTNTAVERGLISWSDDTNIYVRFGSSDPTFTIYNKSTGAIENITNSSWRLFVKSYAKV